MAIPLAIAAAGARAAAEIAAIAALESATTLAVSKVVDKDQYLPTIITVENRTQYNFVLDEGKFYLPTGSGIEGRSFLGSDRSYVGEGPPSEIFSDLVQSNKGNSAVFSSFGNGTDSVAGCVTYSRQPVVGAVDAASPKLAITFAWWCVAGDGRAAVLYHSSGRAWDMKTVWKASSDCKRHPLSTIPFSKSWVRAPGPTSIPKDGYHSNSWDGAAAYGDSPLDFITDVSISDLTKNGRGFQFVVNQTGYEPWTYEPPAKIEFDFVPLMDSPGNDIAQLGVGKTGAQMLEIARGRSNVEAFNTNGWFKDKLQPQSDWVKWSTDPTQGIYVRRR